MKLVGKVAVVTGASRGIGRGIAKELAKEGAYVVINYRENDVAAESLLEEIKGEGLSGCTYKCDVSDYKSTNCMIESILERVGKIDILVNNAGISSIGLFMDNNEEDFEEIMNTNFKSVFNTSRSIVDHMISRKQGVIINISSIWGNVGASCEVLYSASKGAINSFTRALGKELGPSNIRVNAISPGVIETEMNSWLSEEDKSDLINEIPLNRMGKAEEIGRLVSFLCSDDGAYVNAQVITIDGGML